MLRNALTLALATLPLAGCGVNLLESAEKKDPAEDATLALERHDEDKAIDILESALRDSPDDPQLLSILATAHAQRAGIEPLEFASRIAESKASSGGSTSSGSSGYFTSMFSLMPEASQANLDDLDAAVDILVSQIPADSRQPGDEFKLALYQTASVILHTKALDTDGDGALSPLEILDLSDTSATGLLSQIAQAGAILAGADPNDASSTKAAAAISKYQSQIDAMDGATQEEKLRNYLAQSSAGSTTTTTMPTITTP